MENVEALLEKAENAIINFEEELGWTEETSSLLPCPCDPTHSVSAKNLEKHSSKCKWKMLGYTDEEVAGILDDEKLPQANLIRLEKIVKEVSPQTTIDKLLTHERYVTGLTPEQRLQIYEAIVSEFKQERLSKLDPFLYEDLDERKKAAENKAETPIDIMKKYRDLSRRRQSYRAKNVHITKRSHTEVLRDVLAVHMEQLRKILNPNYDQNDDGVSDTRKERRREDSPTADRYQRKSREDRVQRNQTRRSQRSPTEDRSRRDSKDDRSQRSPSEDHSRRRLLEDRSKRSPTEDRYRRKSEDYRSQRSPPRRSQRSPIEDRPRRKSREDKKLKRSRSRSRHRNSEDRSLKKRKKDRFEKHNSRTDRESSRELEREKSSTRERSHHKSHKKSNKKSHKHLESTDNESIPKHKKKKKKR